jgi:hypothetical protein
MRQAVLPLVLLAALLAASLPVQAVPGVPYCPGTVAALPGAGGPAVVQPDVCESVTGRVFPEASALSVSPGGVPVSDFISFGEFEAGLAYLAAQHPDRVTVHEVARSVGWDNAATGQHQDFPVYMVELTNRASPVPLEERQSLLFMLSIHGLETGGREGGFRVLEDLAAGRGIALETVQAGAGLPTPIAKPGGGGNVQTYADYLDFMRVFLLFPNPDGWVHEEAEYEGDGAGTCIVYCRQNGNLVDLNRQAPTLGWQNPNRNVVGEPEAIGYYSWMLQQGIDWSYAIDIHGMLNHQNFVAIMLPAASMTPQEMQRTSRLSETLKDRLNNDPHFDGWRNAFAAAEQASAPTQPVAGTVCAPMDPTGLLGDCPLAGSALSAAGSSQFAEYYTVIDAIGYTDSGFNGDYFAQDTGLDAPGYDIELAYSPLGATYATWQVVNDYHVQSVRQIAKSFMDAAALDVKISFETHGRRTTVVEPSFVATNADDAKPTPGGWADENPGDDLWDYGPDQVFAARPARYWSDLKPFVRDGDEPGVLTLLSASSLDAAQLGRTDTLVIPGSAIDDLEPDPASIAAIRAWVEGGGDLVLTDEALRFLDLAGVTSGAADVAQRYMGGIKMDLAHPVFYPLQDTAEPRNVRGGVKQTYEPTPIGFETGANAAPNWFLDPAKFGALDGATVAGLECGTPRLDDPCTGNGVALGSVPLGAGRIQFIGALLPDPTEEFYHPYGLDPYATTYSGNQVLRNMLLWTDAFEAPPVVVTAGEVVDSENEPQGGPAPSPQAVPEKDTPSLGGAFLAALVALAAGALRSRRSS